MPQSIDFGNEIIQIQQIYSKLERTVIVLKSAFSPHLVVILVMKFTTLTSLLYFCCMVIIKYGIFIFLCSYVHKDFPSTTFYLLLYRIISGIRLNRENKDQLFSSWAWICAHILEIFILCYSSAITINESRKLGCNLHNFAQSLNDFHCKIKVN